MALRERTGKYNNERCKGYAQDKLSNTCVGVHGARDAVVELDVELGYNVLIVHARLLHVSLRR